MIGISSTKLVLFNPNITQILLNGRNHDKELLHYIKNLQLTPKNKSSPWTLNYVLILYSQYVQLSDKNKSIT